jgi:hypothetical protein
MMNSSTRRRRNGTRDVEEGKGASSSLLEILVSYFSDRVARRAMLRVTRGVHDVVRWTVLRLVMGWLGAVIMTGGLLLLLAAGVKGLEALSCPVWLAYLSTAVFAILVALAVMKGIVGSNEEEAD